MAAFLRQARLLSAAASGTRQLASLAGVAMPSSTSLWDVVNREQWERNDDANMTGLWLAYHSDPSKQRVATVVPRAEYLELVRRAAESPSFVLPVHRGPGAFETFMLQCQLPLVLFTSLEDYKRHGPSAAPHFSLTYYTELLDTRGLALVRGDIMQPTALSAQQASGLLHRVHDFYLDARRYAAVHAFNHRPTEFEYDEVLREALRRDGSSADEP